ncbi:tail fiber/spike domain-containing protein [Enterobacter kobei]|uniref:tail fiber/spike domain-containing protein n=1 Tax=Enterobacter kobei TaxID=208224 RepID=UPI0032AEC783
MATQPTQDAVPSESPRDLKFNAGKIDEFVTSMGWTYTDRFGQKHYTIEGINYLAQQAMNAFGYVILTGKTFTTGATINNPNEVLLNTADGEYYKWTGSFASGPKVVPANSTPASTGGIAPGAWIGVGDSSLRAALAATGGAGLVGLSVGSVYPAGTVGSAIQYRTPQMYGIEPSTTNIIGSGLDAMFAAGGDIRFEKPGTYITDRTWVLRSGTRLWIGPGVTIKLANGSNVPVFKNYSYANSAGVDAYIEIWGAGTIDYNGANQTVVGLGSMASILKGITSLKIGGGIKVIGANKYAWLVCNVTYLTAVGLNFDTNSDGLHCQPPIRHAYIRNLKGKTGDDMLAFTIGDYANYNISEPGDFSDVDAEGLFCNYAHCAVKITGDGTGNFVRFRISGIYGDTEQCVVRVWGDANLTKTVVKNLTIENIFAKPGSTGSEFAAIEINDRGFGTSGYSIEVDTLLIRNLRSQNDAQQSVYFAGTFGSVIHDLVIDGLPRSAFAIFGVNNVSTLAVDNLTIKNGNIVFQDNANSAVVVNRGTITNMNIEDVACNFASTNNGQVARLIAGCTVTRANWVNVYQLRGQRGWNHITSAMTGGTELNLTNYTCDGEGRIAQVTGSTLKVRMSNCRRINDTGAQTAFFASGGAITLSGSLETGFNTIGTNSGGVIKTTPGVHNIPCNVDLLTSVDGASVHNLNATLSCGAGRVLVQAKVWKNLFSGATYTSSI